jgi:hypothetical protein
VRSKWNDTADFVGCTPRPGASITSFDDNGRATMAWSGPTKVVNGILVRDDTPRPRRPARPTHIHIHWPHQVRTHDQARPAARRGGDQAQPALLCKVAQDGKTGEWSGVDGAGRPLRVEAGASGLEIYSVPEEAGDNVFGQTDPEGAARTAGKAADMALLAPGGPRREGGDCAGLAALQRTMDQAYRRG